MPATSANTCVWESDNWFVKKTCEERIFERRGFDTRLVYPDTYRHDFGGVSWPNMIRHNFPALNFFVMLLLSSQYYRLNSQKKKKKLHEETIFTIT